MRVHRGRHRTTLVVAWLSVVAVIGVGSARADTEDGARKHAAKANRLKEKNKCKAAIPEFTRAYRTLKDPTLLFNRAECLRKLGKDDEALKDYEQFLIDLPGTPNRASVESRIALLRGAQAPARPAPAPAVQEAAGAAPKEVPVSAPKEAAVAAPGAVPAAKPADKAATPAAPAPAAEKPAVNAAAPTPAPTPPSAAPAAPVAPAVPSSRRAEKWTD